tara:strand:- start:7 stop:453 length:447 start_codon:yes stop_codon:yes gene_type:complete
MKNFDLKNYLTESRLLKEEKTTESNKMKKSDLKNLIMEMAIQEMAKITGDLEKEIKRVIKANPDLEKKDLRKAIRADKKVDDALGEESLFDNQLNRYIETERGERVAGTRGRKASVASTMKKDLDKYVAKPTKKGYDDLVADLKNLLK